MSSTTEKQVPPYLPWDTFKTFITHLKATAVPSRIDKSVMPEDMPRLVRGQVQSCLRFLGLVGASGETNDLLKKLVDSCDRDTWKTAVREAVVNAYATLIGDLNIDDATQHQLDEKFKAVDVDGQMLLKCVRFYLAAMKDAGMNFSPHLNARRNSPSPSRRRIGAGKSSGAKDVDNQAQQIPKKPPASIAAPTVDDPGTQRYPLYFRGKPSGALIVPCSLTLADCKVIELQLEVLKAYAGNEDVK